MPGPNHHLLGSSPAPAPAPAPVPKPLAHRLQQRPPQPTDRQRFAIWVTGTAARLIGENHGAPAAAALYCSLGGVIKAQFLLSPFTGSACKRLTRNDGF